MLLLHLSDIHFREEEIHSHMDENVHLRNEIIRDAKALCERLAKFPSAILISGDVAFAAKPSEYEFAQEWIERLANQCRVNVQDIFVVPGNHDIDRAKAGSIAIDSLHERIKGNAQNSLHKDIARCLNDAVCGAMLFEPLSNYNQFAIKYMCSMSAPQRTIINRDFKLNDGSLLKVHGINSALISSSKDKEGNLVVAPSFNNIIRDPGVVNLSLCHHPFSWLKNGRDLEDHLDAVAQIQLFGHEHDHRIKSAKNYLRIFSDALHPDRGEGSWEPGYNLIDVSVQGTGSDRILKIQTHVRIWQKSQGQFSAKLNEDEGTVFHHEIKLASWSPDGAEVATKKSTDPQVNFDLKVEKIGGLEMESLRNIWFRYFKLSFGDKLKIALKLDLFEESDQDLPDLEKFNKVLIRAKEKNLIEQIEKEINSLENN